MTTRFEAAIPVLPASDVGASLRWWTEICGFSQVFCYGEPLSYAGLARDGAQLHLSLMSDAKLARIVGDQTMLRFQVAGVEEFFEQFQARYGTVHPNGGLQRKPWGSLEFSAIDPCGVCVTFGE